MSTNQFNSFDDFIRFCNTTYNNNNNNNNNNKCNNCEFGNKNAEADESARCSDSDIPGGFQDLDPQLLVIGTSVLGAILAGKMPFNVQNAVANWLSLLAQSIETFNAQQQYFQGGPGRIYNPIYRNVANPYCTDSSDESQRNVSRKPSSSNEYSETPSTSISLNEILSYIDELNSELVYLKKEVENLKNMR